MLPSSSVIVLVLFSLFEFQQAISERCPPIQKRDTNFTHHAFVASRFDGLECSKLINLDEVCSKNITNSLTNATLQTNPRTIITSCQQVDRQDQYLFQLTPASTPFPVVCVKHHQLTGDGWIVIQQRIYASWLDPEDFYRSWVEYREGFGRLNYEFWLGLEHIYQITNSGRHELLVEMVDFENRFFYARYGAFEIGSEQERYILKKLGSYSGTAGNALKVHVGMGFSTFDSDNDRIGETRCSVKLFSGWWFNDCYKNGCNLNARFVSKVGRDETVRWSTTPPKVNREMQYTRMMLRKTI